MKADCLLRQFVDMEVNGNIIEPGADLTNPYLWNADLTGETLTED